MKTVSPIYQQIMDILNKLSSEDQQRVLTFAQLLLEQGAGMTPAELRAFFGQYHFTQEEADEITKIYQELEQSEP